MKRKGGNEAQSLGEELLRERDSGIALGRLATVKQKVTHAGVYGRHKLDLIVKIRECQCGCYRGSRSGRN